MPVTFFFVYQVEKSTPIHCSSFCTLYTLNSIGRTAPSLQSFLIYNSKMKTKSNILNLSDFTFHLSDLSYFLSTLPVYTRKGALALAKAPSYKSGYNILTRTLAVPSARCREGGLTAYTKKRASLTEALSKKSGDANAGERWLRRREL